MSITKYSILSVLIVLLYFGGVKCEFCIKGDFKLKNYFIFYEYKACKLTPFYIGVVEEVISTSYNPPLCFIRINTNGTNYVLLMLETVNICSETLWKTDKASVYVQEKVGTNNYTNLEFLTDLLKPTKNSIFCDENLENLKKLDNLKNLENREDIENLVKSIISVSYSTLLLIVFLIIFMISKSAWGVITNWYILRTSNVLSKKVIVIKSFSQSLTIQELLERTQSVKCCDRDRNMYKSNIDPFEILDNEFYSDR
ncbi:unnamed protein product [Psylliodes chrysocephalus]|uniref:Uncharacterized protein n=1 Tax=Psylliodes chrysocephalus TaxID=3402493 RepID=A0A9P0CPV2_9CUCU|nr:unnamed protein product [Psylliodes chrysocephala]